MQLLINEARRVLSEGAEHEEALAAMHNEAAKKLAAAIKSGGVDAKHVPGSHWSSGVLVYHPKGARSGFDFSVIGQHLPRPGYQFAIKLMPPMMGKNYGAVQDVWAEMPFAFREINNLFKRYGNFKLTTTDRIISVWGQIPDDKVEKLINDAPGLMTKIGKRIAKGFKDAGPA